MCAHNASGHGIDRRQAIRTPYQLTNIQAHASPNKFNHLSCECAHTMRKGMVLVIRPYIHIYIVTNIQARVRLKKKSPPNLSEGGSLRSPIKKNHITFISSMLNYCTHSFILITHNTFHTVIADCYG